MKNLDLHLTHLVGWAVQTFGKAIVYATVIPGLLAIAGAAIDAPVLIAVAIVLVPLIFGGVLWQADAPFPVEPSELPVEGPK